ncbi:MAG: RHS repeat-associated core domain-containing protein [Verrucomicrobia bacterium]|nr:RHS repeat-associated core domain-containing protein [Verrucomicrobiota bacterium]
MCVPLPSYAGVRCTTARVGLGLCEEEAHGFDEGHAPDFDEEVDGVARLAGVGAWRRRILRRVVPKEGTPLLFFGNPALEAPPPWLLSTLENNRNLIDTVANTWDTTLISQLDYTNDKAGRRTAREDSGTAFTSTQNNIFGYNDRNEVTTATMRNGESIYNFDQIGNRVLADVPTALFSPGGVFDYTTNPLNQYTSIASTPSTPSTPTHDDDGNLTDDGQGLFIVWNGENRMVRVEKGDMVMLNTFDGQGRRVRKQVFDDGTPDKDIRYFYDGWNLIYEIDVLAAAEPTYYVWGLDLSQSLQGAGGVGGLLMVHNDGTTWAPTYDANGNISEYINLANGDIDAHLEYDAFGRIIASTGTAPSNFGFSTKYEDAETGYLYYGFRFYDPVTGRWPNRDPIEEMGGYNLYGFVGNDGVNHFDYLGYQRGRFYCLRLAARIAATRAREAGKTAAAAKEAASASAIGVFLVGAEAAVFAAETTYDITVGQYNACVSKKSEDCCSRYKTLMDNAKHALDIAIRVRDPIKNDYNLHKTLAGELLGEALLIGAEAMALDQEFGRNCLWM